MFHLLGSVWRIVEQGIPMKATWWEIFQKAFKPCIYYIIYIYHFPFNIFHHIRRHQGFSAEAITICSCIGFHALRLILRDAFFRSASSANALLKRKVAEAGRLCQWWRLDLTNNNKDFTNRKWGVLPRVRIWPKWHIWRFHLENLGFPAKSIWYQPRFAVPSYDGTQYGFQLIGSWDWYRQG